VFLLSYTPAAPVISTGSAAPASFALSLFLLYTTYTVSPAPDTLAVCYFFSPAVAAVSSTPDVPSASIDSSAPDVFSAPAVPAFSSDLVVSSAPTVHVFFCCFFCSCCSS
jgi:hypothetical protein